MFFNKSVRFNPREDIPSLKGKIILVTGGNAGLGKQCVLDYARHQPDQIWLASRSLEKAQKATDDVKAQVGEAVVVPLELDLASFQSVKRAADRFVSESSRLDILMLNAGIMAAPPDLTEDGYEIQLGTNHMGHALLTKLLLPLLLKTAEDSGSDVRVVSLSSRGHTAVPRNGFRFDTPRTQAEDLGAYGRYYQSKLANTTWARHLATVYPQIKVASIHPGVVQTELMDRATATPTVVKVMVKVGYRLLTTVEDGVKNQLWASVTDDLVSGEYYEPVGVRGRVSDDGKDDELAKRVFEWTDAELESWLKDRQGPRNMD